jgi:hypothetical protein
MNKEQLKAYWERIPRSNSSDIQIPSLFEAYTRRPDLVDAVIEGMKAN